MAKRFTFRFETMLKIRQQREDEQKRVLADRLRQIAQVRERMTSLNRQIAEETDAVRAGQGAGAIDIQQVMRHRHWLGHLHKGVLEAEARRRFLEARLAQERAVLLEAVKQRRILQKLKERRLERHRAEEERQETRQRDEMSTIRYAFEMGSKTALAVT